MSGSIRSKINCVSCALLSFPYAHSPFGNDTFCIPDTLIRNTRQTFHWNETFLPQYVLPVKTSKVISFKLWWKGVVMNEKSRYCDHRWLTCNKDRCHIAQWHMQKVRLFRYPFQHANRYVFHLILCYKISLILSNRYLAYQLTSSMV